MNCFTFSGYLGKDPETQYFESGKVKTKFSVGIPDFNAGEKGTIWVNCECWGERGEKLAENFRQGKAIEIIGRLRQDEYNGNKRYFVDVQQWGFPPANKEKGESAEPKQQESAKKTVFKTRAERDAYMASQGKQTPAQKEQDDLDALFAGEDELPY